MAKAFDLFVPKDHTEYLRQFLVVGLIFITGNHTHAFQRTADSFGSAASVFEHFTPAHEPQDLSVSPAAIAYTFSVDKSRPTITDSLVYTIAVWNDPLLSDTLRRVEAEFSLPRLPNNNFALQLATFRYNGPYPYVIDAAQGKITWQLADIARHTPPLSNDTVRVTFSFRLADVSEFALECGENPLTAFARVSFLDARGQRIFPGTQRAAESTLVLTPDMIATSVTNSTNTIQRGDTLARTYSYRNAGNVGRNVKLCLQVPNGFGASSIRVVPSALPLQILTPDSICVDLGFIAAGSSGAVTLLFPIEQNLPTQVDSLCLRGELVTDCDREPVNNFYQQTCFQITPLDLLALTKTAERNLIAVGDTLAYTIRFENLDSFVAAWNVTITDLLPLGVDFITADAPFTFVNGVLSWQRAQLLPRQSGILRFTVRVRPDYYATQSPSLACVGAQLANSVTITSTTSDGSPSPEAPDQLANNRSTATVSLAPLEDLLEINQTLSAFPPANLARLLPGDTLLYVLDYGNRSNRITAENVSVIDSLPEARFVQLLLPSPPGFIYDATNHVLRRENFSLAPNENATVRFHLVLRNSNALCTTLALENRARIFSSNTLDCRLDNNATVTSLNLPAQQNLLRLRVQVPGVVASNGSFSVVLNYANLSDLTLTNVVARNVLAYPLNVRTINNGGVFLGANDIQWLLGALAPRATGSVSFEAQVLDSVFCGPLAAQNLAWLSSEPRDCDTSDDTSRTALTISASPPEEQARLLVQRIDLSDANGDGCAEAGERLVARVLFVNENRRNLPAQQIRFSDARAVLGARFWPMTLLDLIPAVVAPNDSGVAVFEFIIAENDFSADTLTFAGAITAEGFCPQTYQDFAAFNLRFCPRPQVALTRVDINDDAGNRDGLAAEGETLNLIVVYQNTGPILADSVDATITISLPGFTLLQATPTTITSLPVRLRSRLGPGQRDSVFIQVRYDNFAFSDQVVVLSAFLQVSAFAGPQPPSSDQILIQRDCFARPNPFIPTRHLNGVRFAPNDGEPVKIFDTQGQLMRALRSSQTWDGRTEDGRLCDPGLYIWKIENACEGTIVVVR